MAINLVHVRHPHVEPLLTKSCPQHWMNVIINGACNHQRMPNETVEEYEKRTGIHLDAHNRETFRKMQEADTKFWDTHVANEERPHNNNQLDCE